MRQASPAALRLSAWAYARMLRAYPASFRAEFGGEMALFFSDCCRDEWRSAGPAGLCRLLARVALDTLVSAPPLWAERLEEVVNGHSTDRRWGFWLADHALPIGGLALLAVGAATSWWAMTLGWAALAIAFFAWFAELDGLLALPRPGRVAVRTDFGFEIPLAFKVQRGERVLLFVREEDPERGDWSDVYTVLDRPKGTDGFEPCWGLPPNPIPSGWSRRGRVPVDDLRFESHDRSTYVTRGSLERSLSAAGVSAPSSMGRVVPESALGRRSVRSVLGAGLVPATLLLFGLRASGTPERPLTRSYHAAAVVNGKIYVMGGAGADNKPVLNVQVYDPATGTWAARANMPTPRGLFGASAVGATIYAVGGTTVGRDKLAVVEAYDTLTDTWTRKADLPTPRNALSTAVVDGKVYALGGWGYDRPEGGWESIDGSLTGQDFATVEAYDPKTDSWATRADMPTPRSHMTVSALGGKIYAIGGGARIVAGRSGEYQSLLEVYDTATNRWARAADPPTPRSVQSSSVVDGRIYVMGGAYHRGPTSSTEELMRAARTLSLVEIYDPASGRWTRGADLATARGWFSTSVVNGKVYVVGGHSLAPDAETPGPRATFPGIEVYTPTQ